MGDMGDVFNDMKEHRRDLRARFGVDCPRCQKKQPWRTPSILLPGQICRVDGYRRPGPRLTDAQIYPAAALEKVDD